MPSGAGSTPITSQSRTFSQRAIVTVPPGNAWPTRPATSSAGTDIDGAYHAKMNNRLVVTGRVFWITGSSRGIGRGVAEHLARSGAAVVVHARSEAALDDVADAIAGEGADVLRVVADVRDVDALAGAAEAIRERFGRLDGLVANVGGAAFGGIADVSVE